MRLSRRFLNLITEGYEPVTRSLRRIDLERLQLFYPSAAASPPPPTTTIRSSSINSIVLPDPIFKFEAHNHTGAGHMCNIACYPLFGGPAGTTKVLSTDHLGRNLLYDASTRDVEVMPSFREPKLQHDYLSLFVPKSSNDNDDDDHHVDGHNGGEDDHEYEDEDGGGGGGGGGSLYLMARNLREVRTFGIAAGQPSEDFQVVFYGNGRATSHCKRLPLPPFVLEPSSSSIPKKNEYPEIRSYAVVDDVVVGGSSHSRIVVSVDGRGTYALDTASHVWSKVGDWTLPFHGKVEYVPELKLWFGLSSSGDGDVRHLAAADLSAMDAHSPPQIAAGDQSWEEIRHPEKWAAGHKVDIDAEDVQLVSLGSGRFCIARFFMEWWHDDDSVVYFVIFTGVQVVQRGLANNGEVKLEMIPHRSMCYDSSPRILQFF